MKWMTNLKAEIRSLKVHKIVMQYWLKKGFDSKCKCTDLCNFSVVDITTILIYCLFHMNEKY